MFAPMIDLVARKAEAVLLETQFCIVRHESGAGCGVDSTITSSSQKRMAQCVLSASRIRRQSSARSSSVSTTSPSVGEAVDWSKRQLSNATQRPLKSSDRQIWRQVNRLPICGFSSRSFRFLKRTKPGLSQPRGIYHRHRPVVKQGVSSFRHRLNECSSHITSCTAARRPAPRWPLRPRQCRPGPRRAPWPRRNRR